MCYFFLQLPGSGISKTTKFRSKRLVARVQIPRDRRRLAPLYKFQLISAIVGLFQKAKACQFCAFQDVPSQVRLVRVRAEKNAKSEMSRDE